MQQMPEVIFDCCVLSNFALSSSLPLLKSLYTSTPYITDFVSAEILRGIQKGHVKLMGIREAVSEGWLKETVLRTKEEKAIFESLSVSLGFGEASSIAVAKSRGFIFACDDKVARREANILGVRLTGTLGILKKAVTKKVIKLNDEDQILKNMIIHGFYSPVWSVREILYKTLK